MGREPIHTLLLLELLVSLVLMGREPIHMVLLLELLVSLVLMGREPIHMVLLRYSYSGTNKFVHICVHSISSFQPHTHTTVQQAMCSHSTTDLTSTMNLWCVFKQAGCVVIPL